MCCGQQTQPWRTWVGAGWLAHWFDPGLCCKASMLHVYGADNLL